MTPVSGICKAVFPSRSWALLPACPTGERDKCTNTDSCVHMSVCAQVFEFVHKINVLVNEWKACEEGERERERERTQWYSYILLSSGLDVILNENKAKMMHITAVMMSQAAYHGYQPAPTGRAPKIIATAPIMTLYSCKIIVPSKLKCFCVQSTNLQFLF